MQKISLRLLRILPCRVEQENRYFLGKATGTLSRMLFNFYQRNVALSRKFFRKAPNGKTIDVFSCDYFFISCCASKKRQLFYLCAFFFAKTEWSESRNEEKVVKVVPHSWWDFHRELQSGPGEVLNQFSSSVILKQFCHSHLTALVFIINFSIIFHSSLLRKFRDSKRKFSSSYLSISATSAHGHV